MQINLIKQNYFKLEIDKIKEQTLFKEYLLSIENTSAL